MGEDAGFWPWASIPAGDLKAEYDRVTSALHAYKIRAVMLAIRLAAAEDVCRYYDDAMDWDDPDDAGAALLVKWRELTDA